MLNLFKALNDWTKDAGPRKKPAQSEQGQDFKLVNRITTFHTSEEVMRHLPDILGRAMARC